MRFSIIQERVDSPFTFQLLSNEDKVLLTSGSFPTRDACTDGIRASIEALRDPESFGIQAGNAMTLRSADGTQLASSGPLTSRQAATQSIADIVAQASQTTQFDVTFTSSGAQQQSRRTAFQRVSPEELTALYHFARASSGAQGFELYRLDDDQLYYFHFNDASGQPLLFGRGFSAAAKRDRRLEAVIKNAGIEKRYEILQDGGEFFFILKARNGQEIARSRNFQNRTGAEQAITYLAGSIPTYKEQYVKKRKPRAKAVGGLYAFDHVSSSGEGGFETYRNPETKQHYFHFNDDQGKALLFSQGYASSKSRDNGIKSVIKNAALPDRLVSKENNGRYYFILRAGNRQEMAQSRFFSTPAERDRWLAIFTGSVTGYAGAYGVSLAAAQTTTTQTESFTLSAPPPVAATGFAAAAGIAASTGGDGGATAEIPEPPAPKPAAKTRDFAASAPAKPTKADREEAYAYAGDDDRGGIRLWLPWIIGLIAVALILFWLLSRLGGCGDTRNNLAGTGNDVQQEIVNAGPNEAQAEGLADDESVAPNTTTENATAENATTANAGAANAGASAAAESDRGSTSADSDGAGSTGEPPVSLGPTATALGFSPGSIEGQIANLLSKPDRSLPATFILDKVNFPRHSAKLNKSAYSQVDNLIKLMKAYPDAKIKFEGHSDGTEDDNIARTFMQGENITLSAVRARCLYQKFIEGGVSANQLGFDGEGASSPVTNNNTESNKQKNRRLEVIISE